MIKAFFNWGNQRITGPDSAWAMLFIVIMTFQPHYADGPLNLFELGLYLPSIDGILHGLIPYKDFFYLRGPLEIYIPALMMKIFGENVAYLSLYFYLGNVLCLIMACLIGAQLFRTRFIFYAFVPILVARTFPRVVYPFWGGLRYVWGLLFVYLMIHAFKTQRGRFFLLAGIAAACAAMTSIEIGVCCFLSSLVLFFLYRKSRPLGLFVLGAAAVLIPFLGYFWRVRAMVPFIEDIQAVVFRSHPTFMTQLTSSSPRTFLGFLHAMIPGAPSFQYMTPLYVFLLMAGFLAWHYYRRSFGVLEFSLVVLMVYALVLYLSAFRIIEGGQFETALQVEKILFFFAIEAAFLWVLPKHRVVAVLFLIGVMLSSWGFTIDRYIKRFPVSKVIRSGFDKHFCEQQGSQEARLKQMTFDRARGVRTSAQQALELESVVSIVRQNTGPRDKIFVYPDMGSYYFLCDRAFVGRFPIGTLAWMREDWHQELMRDLNTQKPKLVILKHKLEDNFTKVYFKRASNKEHFEEIARFIDAHYSLIATTPVSGIYLIKK